MKTNPHKLSPATYESRCAAFAESEKLKAGAEAIRNRTGSPTTTAKPTDKQNPYLKARLEVLSMYPELRRKEILEMEQKGDINNRFYLDFVREVARLGDKFKPI